MQRNLPVEDANSSESEHDNSSIAEHLLTAFRKEDLRMVEKIMEVIVIRAVQKVIGQIADDLVRKVVKEEIQSAQQKVFTHQNRNSVDEATTSRPRALELKFLGEVSDPVLTGKEIKGKEGNDIKISLLDNVNGLPVIFEPEAPVTVEILILEAGPNDNISNMSRIDFNNSISRENDKGKPHFPKRVYVSLEKGIGVLSNVRLGHGARWTKNCQCRLWARVDASDGSIVKEAWTNSFMVRDRRSKHYEKHHPPELSDHVWRLDHIGRDGDPCKRLNDANINTVQDFLFFLNIDPRKLQTILRANDKTWSSTWSSTVNHARQCILDDTQIYFYNSSTEDKTGVVFDAVGQLKGRFHDRHFFPIESVSESEKEEAGKLLACALENREDITSLDEISFRHQFSRSISNATNSSRLDDPDHNRSVNEVTVVYDPTQSKGIGPSFNRTNGSSHFHSPVGDENAADARESSHSSLDYLLKFVNDIEILPSVIDGLPQIPSVESVSGQQTTSVITRFIRIVMILRWLFRVRKMVASVTHWPVQKRQRQA